MKVLAVGAAGKSAGLVVQALDRIGVEVRGLVHSSGREATARDNGASETFVADLLDRSALRAAVEGCDGVFHVIPAFTQNEATTGTTLVEVADEAGIERFVFSSVYHPSLTALSNHREKQPAEEALFNSSMEFTILQPAMFMSQLDGLVDAAKRDGVISGPYSAVSTMCYVDYRDVAEIAALSFVDDRFANGTFELSAPGMYSRHDLADLLSDILDRSVRADQTPADLPDGMPEPLRRGLARMFDHYDRFGFHGGNSLILATMLGHQPTSVPNYLRAVADDELLSQMASDTSQ